MVCLKVRSVNLRRVRLRQRIPSRNGKGEAELVGGGTNFQLFRAISLDIIVFGFKCDFYFGSFVEFFWCDFVDFFWPFII